VTKTALTTLDRTIAAAIVATLSIMTDSDVMVSEYIYKRHDGHMKGLMVNNEARLLVRAYKA
jgi:hypothetical protein